MDFLGLNKDFKPEYIHAKYILGEHYNRFPKNLYGPFSWDMYNCEKFLRKYFRNV
jgi:hypothetical protein